MDLDRRSLWQIVRRAATCVVLAGSLVVTSVGAAGAATSTPVGGCTMAPVPQMAVASGGVAGAIVDVSAPVGVQLLGGFGVGAWLGPERVIAWHGANVVVVNLAVPSRTRPGAYAGSVRLSCGAPVPVVVHVVAPIAPARRRGGGSLGLGTVPVVRVVAGASVGAVVAVQNPGAVVTLGGAGVAGRWVVPAVIARGGVRDVAVVVHVPSGTPVGRYDGSLVLSLAPPRLPAVPTTGGVGATVSVGYRVVQALVVVVSG